VILRSSSGHETFASIALPNTTWQRFPELPNNTAIVTIDGVGVPSAIVASGSTFRTWVLSPARHRWQKGQTVQVPIQYESSS
jgi:hypothetical protein